MVKVVYAYQPISTGTLIFADMLTEREIEEIKSPQTAIPKLSTAVGHIARRNIALGSVLVKEDLKL